MNVRYHTRYSEDDYQPRFNAVLDVQFSSEGSEPVTLLEAKNWCRVDVTDDNSLITELITSARIICEQYTNISFITRTVTAVLQNSCGKIFLPYGPVSTISSYTDRDSNQINDPKVYGVQFKYIEYPVDDYIKVVYTAGYSTLPPNLKTALLSQIQWMYDNRGDASLSVNSKMILRPVRRV